MSKTWKVPAGTEQRIARKVADHGSQIRAGSTIANMTIVRAQGMGYPSGMSDMPVTSPVDGRILYWPGMDVGVVVRDGEAVFSVFSDQEWDDLREAVGSEVRSKMSSWPVRLTRQEFEAAISALNQLTIMKLFGR